MFNKTEKTFISFFSNLLNGTWFILSKPYLRDDPEKFKLFYLQVPHAF